MDTWKALLLGIIQGLTEFLPVSSSGHLALSQHLLGFQNLKDYVLFDLICHLGTLSALLFFFAASFRNFPQKSTHLKHICIGTLPLFPVALFLKPITALFDAADLLGWCFLFSAFILFFSTRSIPLYTFSTSHKWASCLTIGIFQAIAVLPGISRSGATISAAKLLGWEEEEAMQFSFFLAIPAILGGLFLETLHYFHSAPQQKEPFALIHAFIGFSSSFVVGYLVLHGMKYVIKNSRWKYFAWYCLIIGLFTLAYFNLLV